MKGECMDKVREALVKRIKAWLDGEVRETAVSLLVDAMNELTAAREALSAQPVEPVVFVDEHVETFVSQYNDVYCDQRKAGVSGGDAERKAMKEVLLFALGAYTAQPACGCRIGECESKPLPFACRMAEEVKRGES